MRTRAQRAFGNAAQEAKRWNYAHGEGTTVLVRRDDGSVIRGRTTSSAYVASGRAVVHVDCIRGFYVLERVTCDDGSVEVTCV